MSNLEDTLAAQMTLAKLPTFKREFCAIQGRRFRWDFAWPSVVHNLLVEVQGGTWAKGAHSSGAGINRDTEKLNLATLSGWRVMQFTGDQIRSGQALRWLQAFFQAAA